MLKKIKENPGETSVLITMLTITGFSSVIQPQRRIELNAFTILAST